MRSDANAVEVRGVTKTYRIGVGRARVREALPHPFDRAVARAFPRWWAKDTFDALHDVSVEVPRGSSLGIVGHNGAGKTTLLKVIAGVTEPTRGSASVAGRVAALIDVLVGFHPDLTGRENVYLLGAIQRYGRKEMQSRLDRIVDFAEIDDLVDTPLKRYSAGMVTRIAFATIASLDVDLLLVDEVLAVGDATFQRKCVRWLEEFRAGGGSLMFVSHNLALVRSMTDQALWIDHGRVIDSGRTEQILARYGEAMERRDTEIQVPGKGLIRRMLANRGMNRWGSGGARVLGVKVADRAIEDDALEIGISYEAPDLREGFVWLGLVDEAGHDVVGTSSPLLRLDQGDGSVSCTLHPPLRNGLYFPVVAISSADGTVRDHWQLDRPIVFERNGNGMPTGVGAVTIPSEWTSEEAET
jgi:ABC-type polysaccharide/polyol phosphate transport system ATPase subunit